MSRNSLALILIPIIVLIAMAVLGRGGIDEQLVVYCAHDSVYADEILQAFERDTGITVVVRYDTEATKSLGLIERILREQAEPECDVLWNNELLGTLDLADRGALAAYRGSGWERMPPAFRDPDGRWVGFGARMRVLLANTELIGDADPAAVFASEPARCAIAKPLYGTTLTHYAVLWRELGEAGLKRWHADTRAAGLREVDGNGRTKQLVVDGVCAVGLTDTDDSFVAIDAGAPVRMQPVRLADGATICIPNTVAIIAGSRNRAAAERLVDYLVSAQTELALAHGRARQVPLGPLPADADLPAELAPLVEWAQAGTPLHDLLHARNAVLAWLRAEAGG